MALVLYQVGEERSVHTSSQSALLCEKKTVSCYGHRFSSCSLPANGHVKDMYLNCLIPPGYDVIAQAQSGTGKTATFAISILQQIDVDRKVTQALVLAPTRELAQQVTYRFTTLILLIVLKVLISIQFVSRE